MSIAKKAVDSTIKRILVYTAEIIAAFILMVIICLPLVFTIPMWVQNVVLGSTSSEYWINPVAWFGMAGAVGITILLAIPSLVFGYITIAKMGTAIDSDDDEESDETDEPEADEPEIDESEEDSEPDEVESIEAEDVEDTSDTSEEE